MHQYTTFYRCCILLSIFGISLSVYLPSMKTTRHHRIDSGLSRPRTQYRDSMGFRWQKRGDWYGAFIGTIRSHANVQQDKRQFVSQIFQLFDINRDGCINQYEFRSILIFLNIL